MADILSTPKNSSLKPYIYKITSFETGQYYIGSQCSGKIVGMNYFTSSTNKEFKNGFKNYGEEKYKIEIIKEFEDPDECVHAENYMIRDHMLLKDGLCLNRACCCNGKRVFSRVGLHHSEETRKRISVANKGFHHSEETRKRISEANKGRPSWNKGVHHTGWNKGFHHSEETRKRISEANKGRPSWIKGLHHSEETRKRISVANKGFHHSEETRKRISEAHKIKISIKDITFDSITAASQYYNVYKSTIRYWIKTKKHNTNYI